ncbi:hypothetical protein COO60DRAFT_924492 [Scenedesmus sp. NREL 46B-D3]|nr:hypothetical protein COO60DRAFT_924492 [Scenedesmus sp. NREL 46B-D3]
MQASQTVHVHGVCAPWVFTAGAVHATFESHDDDINCVARMHTSNGRICTASCLLVRAFAEEQFSWCFACVWVCKTRMHTAGCCTAGCQMVHCILVVTCCSVTLQEALVPGMCVGHQHTCCRQLDVHPATHVLLRG